LRKGGFLATVAIERGKMGLIDGPVGALYYASAQRPRGLAGHDVQINPADPHYPWMETGVIDYGISELLFYRIGYGPRLGWE
jgi:hypothetical protein